MSRDWLEWYRQYEDPASSLSRRLGVVQQYVEHALAIVTAQPTALGVRVVSMCAGDGRDVLPVLAKAPRSPDLATLLSKCILTLPTLPGGGRAN